MFAEALGQCHGSLKILKHSCDVFNHDTVLFPPRKSDVPTGFPDSACRKDFAYHANPSSTERPGRLSQPKGSTSDWVAPMDAQHREVNRPGQVVPTSFALASVGPQLDACRKDFAYHANPSSTVRPGKLYNNLSSAG